MANAVHRPARRRKRVESQCKIIWLTFTATRRLKRHHVPAASARAEISRSTSLSLSASHNGVSKISFGQPAFQQRDATGHMAGGMVNMYGRY